MCYAVRREVPLRFFDLPLVHHLAFWKEREEQSVNEKSGEEGVCDEIPGETFDAEISGKAVVSAVSELLPVDLLLIWRKRPGTMIRNMVGSEL